MNAITAEHHWKPIDDYDRPPEKLAVPELRALTTVWQEQRGVLEQQRGLQEFNARLKREWSVETGLLERIYTLDRGVTELLIQRGLDSSLIPHDAAGQDPEHVVAVLRDHEAAIDFLFDVVKGQRVLTPGFVKELHALLTRNQAMSAAVDSLGRRVEVPLVRGAYKKPPNNPSRPDGVVHEYCPPEHVDSEMERLLELHAAHGGVAPEVEAAWLHHRFTQIHPFQDGNGRVARALATLVFIRAGWFPLVIRDVKEERTRYLGALEAADFGDLVPLVSSFAAAQRKAFAQALGVSTQVLKHARAEQVISATRELLAKREADRRREWERSKATAAVLQNVAEHRFRQIAVTLERETRNLLAKAEFFVDFGGDHDGRGHYFRNQVIQTAKALDYFANLSEYREWVRLGLQTDSRAELLISFHGIGHEFRGVLAVSACFFRREQTEQGEREISALVPLSDEIFQVNYKEAPADAESRFVDWLEDVLVRGLESWRQGL
jgi:hypothetical protein